MGRGPAMKENSVTSFRKEITMKRWMIVGAVMSVVMGCSSSPVMLSQDYGTSLARMKESQILHPEAPAKLAPPVGLDGRGSVTAYKQYLASFERKSEAPEAGTIIGTMLTPK